MIVSTVGLVVFFIATLGSYFVISGVLPGQKGYFSFFPSLPFYPNNEQELEVVKTRVKLATEHDINFFHQTDVEGPLKAFRDQFPENKDIWDNHWIYRVLFSPIIVALKLLINRQRPYHVDPYLKYQKTMTTLTPSFPSGHSFEAYLLARRLSKRNSSLADSAQRLANKCSDARVNGGVHYPSDAHLAKICANSIPKWIL